MPIVELDKNGYVVGYASEVASDVEIPGSVEVDELPEDFDMNFSHYYMVNGSLVKNENYISEADRDEIRYRRDSECFAIVDRPLWLQSLSQSQMDEIIEWRKAWLDAPNTAVIPEKPEWIK